VNRKLYKIQLSNQPHTAASIKKIQDEIAHKLKIDRKDLDYFVVKHTIENNAYNPASDHINILYKDGSTLDITKASDNLNIEALARPVKKYALAYFRI
jgi:hypothetical protein